MNTLGKFILLLPGIVVFTGASPGQQVQPKSDADLAGQLNRLDPKNEQTVRLSALGWLATNALPRDAATVMAALEKCIRNDPEWPVRQRAVRVLGQLARGFEKPCPLKIFEAMHDKDDFVRYEAVVAAGLFKEYAPGSTSVLLRGAKADNAELRSSSVMLLDRPAKNDPKALAAIEEATRDKVLDVRHTAHMALFRVKDHLEDHLRYLIRVREVADSFLTPGEEHSEQGKQERQYRNLVILGSGLHLAELGESRADEMADVFLKLLTDKSADQRRGAANLIGALVVKHSKPPKRDFFQPFGEDSQSQNALELLLPKPAAPAKKDVPAQKSNVALRLEKLGVQALLRKLQDDPDRSVRDAAKLALDQLARAQAK